MEYGFSMRGQYPGHADMQLAFREVCEMARVGDKLGYSYLTKGQHYAHGPTQAFQQLPFLARIMAEAPNVKIVSAVLLLGLHKPLEIAEQFATLDVMSGGRLIFGCAIGYREVEFKAFGMDPKERGARFDENLAAVRRLWTEKSVSMKGSHFELDNASPSIVPMQKPMPPIWIGANKDISIKRAARLADAWIINPHQRIDTLEQQIVLYNQELASVGKPKPSVLPLMRECFVARTHEEAIRLARPLLMEKYKLYHEWGQDKSMAKGDDDLTLSFDQLVDGRFLVGSVDEVAEQIVDYRKRLGITAIIPAFQQVGTPHAQVLDAMHLFAEEVMPKVKRAI